MPTKRPTHKPPQNASRQHERPTRTNRGYNNRWRRARLVHLAENPLCIVCGKLPDEHPHHVDHIVDHHGDYDLFWDPTNWQTLCQQCHSRKTRTQHTPNYYSRRFVVMGDPGCGKTMYVQSHALPSAVVWDYDAILGAITLEPNQTHIPLMEKLKQSFIESISGLGFGGEVWIITANKQSGTRIAKSLGAEIIDQSKIEQWRSNGGQRIRA